MDGRNVDPFVSRLRGPSNKSKFVEPLLSYFDWTTLLGCLIFDVAKSRSEKQWPYSFCSYVEKKVDVVWPGHMPVPMAEILNVMQLRFRVHMCVGKSQLSQSIPNGNQS